MAPKMEDREITPQMERAGKLRRIPLISLKLLHQSRVHKTISYDYDLSIRFLFQWNNLGVSLRFVVGNYVPRFVFWKKSTHLTIEPTKKFRITLLGVHRFWWVAFGPRDPLSSTATHRLLDEYGGRHHMGKRFFETHLSKEAFRIGYAEEQTSDQN